MEIRTKDRFNAFRCSSAWLVVFISLFPCVYREKETPSSIPNLAVKLLFADDTALCKCGNVGRCKDRDILLLFFLFHY